MKKRQRQQTDRTGSRRKAGDRSLSFYIGRVFMILVAVDILFALLLLFSYRQIRDRSEIVPITRRVSAGADLLAAGRYGKLGLNRYLGRGGYYEVVDEDANVIYTSRASVHNSYSAMILTYIPDMDRDSYVFAIPFDDQYGTGYILGRIQTEEEGDVFYDRLKGILVINGRRDIRFSNMQNDGKSIRKKELRYILETSETNSAGDYILQKYGFKGPGDAQRYLLIHMPAGRKSATARTGRLVTSAILVFIAGILASIVVAAFLIVRKIRQPMKKLNTAMTDFAGGNVRPVDCDAGIREFDKMLLTYNRMTEALRQSEQERRSLEEQRRKMLAGISHDLKTPVTVLRGYIGAMQDGLIPAEEQAKYLKIMSEKTDLIADLVKSFGEYSRLEHPEFRFTLQEGDLAEYLREYMARRYEELEIAGYGLEADIPEREVSVCFDAEQLSRVFNNILSNTMKYTAPGTTIRCSLAVRGNDAVIRLGDDGPGMEEQLKAEAFRPFVTGDNARKSGQGTGLGLSIAKRIVEGHHGTIRILSAAEWPQGTMYEICLPLAAA